MTRRILVIGGLAAGPSAAAKAVRTNPDVEVVVFEQGEHVSYGICEVPYYIAGEVKLEGLVPYTPQQLREKKGIEVCTLQRVEEIQPTRRLLTVRDLRNATTRVERFDRLIIATGSRPRRLGIAGEDARNVFHVQTLDDGIGIKKYIEEEAPGHAVIVGGGYIGMEMADALRRHGLEVTILHRHSLPMAGLEREARERVREELEQHGVTFVAHARTEGFVLDKSQRVTHVVTSAGSHEANIVVLSLGVVPHSELAKRAGIRLGVHGGIRTDQTQHTNLDNVYAAGDCCEVRNLVNNKWMYIPLATIAARAARVAGENAAGGKAVFRGAIRAVAVNVFDLEVAQVGISSEEAKESGFDVITETVTAWSKVAVMPGSRRVSIKLIADRKSKRLLGANVWGRDGSVMRANTLAVAIQHRLTIDDIRQWDLAYSPPLTPLWDPILVSANAIHKKTN